MPISGGVRRGPRNAGTIDSRPETEPPEPVDATPYADPSVLAFVGPFPDATPDPPKQGLSWTSASALGLLLYLPSPFLTISILAIPISILTRMQTGITGRGSPWGGRGVCSELWSDAAPVGHRPASRGLPGRAHRNPGTNCQSYQIASGDSGEAISAHESFVPAFLCPLRAPSG